MKPIPRIIEPVVRQRLQQQVAVVLLGPRQVGKTTLARRIADERGEAATDPRDGPLAQSGRPRPAHP